MEWSLEGHYHLTNPRNGGEITSEGNESPAVTSADIDFSVHNTDSQRQEQEQVEKVEIDRDRQRRKAKAGHESIVTLI